jgi:poly(beta-D-mannuronate) lyase
MKTMLLRAATVALVIAAGMAAPPSPAQETPGKPPESTGTPSAPPASSSTGTATTPSPAALVDSLEAFQSSIDAALPGETITLKNGTYTTRTAIRVGRRGASDAPITLAAESVGGVEITGTNGFNVIEPAEYVVISGFKLTHAGGKNSVAAGTSHVRFTRCVFRCTGDGPYLSLAGDDAEIDHNEFADKKSAGSMVAVGGTGSQVARRAAIHHNHFHDFASAGAVGSEMIRLGLGAMSTSTGGAVVEHNLFERCRGENELISNRSSGNIFRYNTLLESPSSQFTLRHGNDCLVYGNIFRNTEGLRIYGDRHQVFSNFFEGNYIGINLGNGSAEMTEGGSLNNHDRPDHCLIAFNTLVDNRTHYQMSRRTPGALGATHTVFANNIISGSGIAAKIEGPNVDATWSGNVLSNSGGAGDVPAAGYTEIDPQLVADASGLRRPQEGSPVFAAATGDFPTITVDLDERIRPAKKSIGAHEPNPVTPTAHLLTAVDVGPAAK